MTEQLKKLLAGKNWLVWSNEHTAWWGDNCCGYGSDIDKAGRYTLEAAQQCCNGRSQKKGMSPPELIQPSPEWLALRKTLLETKTQETPMSDDDVREAKENLRITRNERDGLLEHVKTLSDQIRTLEARLATTSENYHAIGRDYERLREAVDEMLKASSSAARAKNNLQETLTELDG